MSKPRNTTDETNSNPLGFLAAAMVMGSSGAIEHQEAQGQRELVNSEALPVKIDYHGRQILESWGFKFGEHDGRDLFIEVEMPAGWKKVSTDHSMWSNLLDDKGRIRGSMFYKAAFYDRDAFMNLTNRFAVRKKYTDSGSIGVEVIDGDQVIHTIDFPPPLPQNADRESRLARYVEEDAIVADAKQWLTERYPDWQKVEAYWD